MLILGYGNSAGTALSSVLSHFSVLRHSPRSWQDRDPPGHPSFPCTTPAHPRPPASRTARLKSSLVTMREWWDLPVSTDQFWRRVRQVQLPRSRTKLGQEAQARRYQSTRTGRHLRQTPRHQMDWDPSYRCWNIQTVMLAISTLQSEGEALASLTRYCGNLWCGYIDITVFWSVVSGLHHVNIFCFSNFKQQWCLFTLMWNRLWNTKLNGK